MAKFSLTAPSKTFLLGEYVALNEGPALVLTTSPRFTLLAESSGEHKIDGIVLSSPAGSLLRRDISFYQNYAIEFIDPYKNLGGFGASSAQFLLLNVFKNTILKKELSDAILLQEYRYLAWDKRGVPPSGVDLIAQRHGGICYFHKKENDLRNFSWPFQELDYCLIHSGNKLATHLHLNQLEKFNYSELEAIVKLGVESLTKQDSSAFVAAINEYNKALDKLNLLAASSKKILDNLKNCLNILAAKGCGALGADVILILFQRNFKDDILSWLKQQNYNVVVVGNSVEKGLEFNSTLI